MTQNITSRPASKSSNFQVIIDDQFYNNVTNTVNSVLRKNAGSWISSEDIEEIASMARVDIWMKSELYDPAKGASFKTWTVTLAHNFAISEAKKLKNAVDRVIDINRLSGFDNGGNTEEDPEKRSRSKKVNYRMDSTFSWAAKELGIDVEEFNADYFFTKESDEAASAKRLANLEEFLATQLNDREKLLLEMLQDGLTKEQMMDRLNMTGGTFDTFRSRFRSKVRNFMIASDYYAAE